MDIRCKFCAEPWDMDSLHDMPADSPYKSNYDAASHTNHGYELAAKLFRLHGCGFFDHAWSGAVLGDCKRKGAKGESQHLIEAIMDINGNDMDGMAADLEDAEQLGLL